MCATNQSGADLRLTETVIPVIHADQHACADVQQAIFMLRAGVFVQALHVSCSSKAAKGGYATRNIAHMLLLTISSLQTVLLQATHDPVDVVLGLAFPETFMQPTLKSLFPAEKP